MTEQSPERLRPLEIPFPPDPVDAPEIVYGQRPADAVYYLTREDEWVRVTFEKLDSLRVCRGEYLPYEDAEEGTDQYTAAFTVDNSRWLVERYRYEWEHYRDCYESGGDVDEMLTDFDHYLIAFHDEYVEALAAGIWLEKDPKEGPDGRLPLTHPLRGLTRETAHVETGMLAGRHYEIWSNPREEEAILRDARLCSQPLWTFVLDSAGRIYDVDVRVRRGQIKTRVRNSLGTPQTWWSDWPELSTVRAFVEPHLRRLVAEERGKWAESDEHQ